MSRILVVDDDPGILDVTKLVLEAGGHSAALASDGEEAVRSLAREKPDVVLLDVMMPGPHGFTVCKSLKSDSRLADVRVVMYSVRSEESDRRLAKESGADGYVAKPCDPQVLLAAIEKALSKPARSLLS